jgi:hypothetical protein
MYKKISFRSAPKPDPGNRAGFFIARTRLKSRYAANAAPISSGGRGGRERERRQAAGGAHDCARQGAPLRPLLLRFVEALNTPVVAPVMGLFGGRRDSFFVNPFKQVTKAPCKFHLLQGACSSPVVCSAPCSCPVVYRVTGCGACVPDAMQHGRSVVNRDQSAPLPTLRLLTNKPRYRPAAFRIISVSASQTVSSFLRRERTRRIAAAPSGVPTTNGWSPMTTVVASRAGSARASLASSST